MVNSWISAIKEYNKDNKYTVPKKGTPQYDAVKMIQEKNKQMISSVPNKETVKGGDGIKEV